MTAVACVAVLLAAPPAISGVAVAIVTVLEMLPLPPSAVANAALARTRTTTVCCAPRAIELQPQTSASLPGPVVLPATGAVVQLPPPLAVADRNTRPAGSVSSMLTLKARLALVAAGLLAVIV